MFVVLDGFMFVVHNGFMFVVLDEFMFIALDWVMFVVLDGFMLVINRRFGNRKFWRCSDKKVCKATVSTDSDTDEIFDR